MLIVESADTYSCMTVASVFSALPSLPQIAPDVCNEMTASFSALINSPSIWEKTRAVQHIGEAMFTASFVIAFLQAAVAILQYRTNPAGELIVPPGRTVGVEYPASKLAGVEEGGTQEEIEKRSNGPLAALKEKFEVAGKEVEAMGNTSKTSRYARILNRFNRFMFLLLPWAFKEASFVLGMRMHMMHITSIIGLARFFDAPAMFFEKKRRNGEILEEPQVASTTSVERLLVIGDSLAVGLGTVSQFDKAKNQSVAYALLENLDAHPSLPGPAFPRSLASELSSLQQIPVNWRSAGVDGGTVSHIHHFCMDVVRQEVAKNRAPDCVVILCGTNDLKLFVANPFRSMSSRAFRQKLADLVVEIRQMSPGAKIILPAIPTQMFRANSPLNIFPLAFFLDAMVSFWESQKKAVVEAFPSDDVMYVALSGNELKSWYDGGEDRSLIAADGVHPSAECYTRWGQSVARNIFKKLSIRKKND